ADHRAQREHAEHGSDARVLERIEIALQGLAEHAAAAATPAALGRHRDPGETHGEGDIGERVQREAEGSRTLGDGDARDGGADEARIVEHDRVDGDRRRQGLAIDASLAGCATAWAEPSASVSRNSSQIAISPVYVSTARRMAWLIDTIWVIRITQMRSRRSASAPAMGLRNTTGARSATATSPSQVPEWVSCQASQPTVTRCSQVPIREMAFPSV